MSTWKAGSRTPFSTNRERIDIQWKQVKTVDELMREGRPTAMPATMRQSQA